MFKNIKKLVWAYDAEWVPDPKAGRLLYKLDEETPDAQVMERMWQEGGADENNPQPYLKTVMCRLVSIAAIQRQVNKDGWPSLRLLSMPRETTGPETEEKTIVGKFLKAMGERQPQMVGYNSIAADMRILVQRGIIHGLSMPAFCRRPNKPWEGVDYFAKGSDFNIDLKDVATPGWGQGSPSLNEMATLSGIPGKMEMDGESVPPMWLEGRLDRIIAYNETDAVTTFLVWLRMAHFGGHLSTSQYESEQELVRELLKSEAEKNGKNHLLDYLTEWDRLQKATS
ncbi:MAG: 3'-5' exonuclease [Magnetococcales bacterium]|nr:3'-5' exonuclease [Magnetococcales bacterium]